MQKQQTEFEQLQSQLEASVQDKVSLHAASTVTCGCVCACACVCVCVCACSYNTVWVRTCRKCVLSTCMYKCLCVSVQDRMAYDVMYEICPAHEGTV